VAVAGYSGDDTIIVSNPAGATGSRLRGSSGDDVILAGPSDDLLNGGPGADVIKGSAGDDLLDGKAGLDSFSGGKGDDEVEADHDDRDRSIRCGPGNDAATVDRDLDPPPSQCQHIRRR
jgi:Ca2+-binding RTX toxin-like protein